MKDFLTEVEISKIEQFCADEAMFDAVKKVILSPLYTDGTMTKGQKPKITNQAFNLISQAYQKDEDISNEVLGQGLRGLFEGVNALEQGFAYLKLIKTKAKEIESPYNTAI
jgi:hypothetical protein